jgi:hypothetical protein
MEKRDGIGYGKTRRIPSLASANLEVLIPSQIYSQTAFSQV